jgi:hypothetical protein
VTGELMHIRHHQRFPPGGGGAAHAAPPFDADAGRLALERPQYQFTAAP